MNQRQVESSIATSPNVQNISVNHTMRCHVYAVCRVGLRQRDEILAVLMAEDRGDDFKLRIAGDVHGTGIPIKDELTGRLGIR